MRDKKNDKFVLVFKGHYNSSSNSDMLKRELTLDRYIKLIKNIYGYTEGQILEEEALVLLHQNTMLLYSLSDLFNIRLVESKLVA